MSDKKAWHGGIYVCVAVSTLAELQKLLSCIVKQL